MRVFESETGSIDCFPWFFRCKNSNGHRFVFSAIAFVTWFWPTWLLMRSLRLNLTSPYLTSDNDFIFFFNSKLYVFLHAQLNNYQDGKSFISEEKDQTERAT